MENKEYIESGILELYVFGLLTEPESEEVTTMAFKHSEVREEIVSIEKAIINLSSSFSPYISSSQFEKIKSQLELKHSKVVALKSRSSSVNYIGWAASLALLIGISFQYLKLNESKNEVVAIEKEKSKLQENVVGLEFKNKTTTTALNIVRDENNIMIALGGQAVAPAAKAKIYWNKQTQVVYVDASGLPEPPKGKEYQIWSLKLLPQLTPTSIGLLSNFQENQSKIFTVDKTSSADAFGITLEPAGGSASPTMEQLHALGKV